MTECPGGSSEKETFKWTSKFRPGDRLGTERSRQEGRRRPWGKALGVFQGRAGGQWAWCTAGPGSNCELEEGFAGHREGVDCRLLAVGSHWVEG